jgi:hypothetical protein
MTILGISLVEWFGYTASVIVAVSLTMASIVKLRWFNLVGAGMFSTYGFIIGALPVGFLNLFITLIDIYYLIRMYQEKADFTILALTGSDQLRDHYLSVHRADIVKFFPKFDPAAMAGLESFWLLKNSVPVGLLAGVKQDETLEIALDYVGPEYRDFKMGAFVYSSAEFFRSRGIRKLAVVPTGGPHDAYLEKMRFARVGGRFEKQL